jgi:hypothetical protein
MNSDLLQNNFKLIKNFISKEKAIQIYKEFKLCDSFYKFGSDPQAPNSSSVYNYLPALEILCEKTQEVSTILGQTVLPTYTYARIYRTNDELKKHTDRESCEISLTLHLYGDKPWPIWIETPNGKSKCLVLEPGDAMMYLGCVAPHWRDEYFGKEYAQFFLHYVRSRGVCAPSYFDKKTSNKSENINKLIEEYKSMGWSNNLITNNFQQEEDYVFPYRKKKEIDYEFNELKKDEDFIVFGEDTPFEINKSLLDIKNENKSTSGSGRTLKDFIKVFENALDAEFCDYLLDEYINDKWTHTLTGSGHDPNARNCSVIPISHQEFISRNQEKRQKIDEYLFEVIHQSLEKYGKCFPETDLEIQEDSGYELLRYDEGQFYVQHTDSFKTSPRALTVIISINDDYEGGEFCFFDRELSYKLKKGSILMFPSNFMYPHEITKVTKGTRYSIITWLV